MGEVEEKVENAGISGVKPPTDLKRCDFMSAGFIYIIKKTTKINRKNTVNLHQDFTFFQSVKIALIKGIPV